MALYIGIFCIFTTGSILRLQIPLTANWPALFHCQFPQNNPEISAIASLPDIPGSHARFQTAEVLHILSIPPVPRSAMS